MQNNITELAQKLLRALDSTYNVIDMATVIEVITLLEKVSITKELLETTRLGKHINELRRNTSNESLAKRAKELLKKWRNKVLSVPPPPAAAAAPAPPIQTTPALPASGGETNGQLRPQSQPHEHNTTINEEVVSKKRTAKEKLETPVSSKRAKLNGVANTCDAYDFSDNSNSSFKDATAAKQVIHINSDSNSSLVDVKHDPPNLHEIPKKRGRKKGSKNHRNLLEEAETAFTTKMAVSRGNAKVKTTQELIASLQQNKAITNTATSPIKNDDWKERAAKLTERVSFIDQKLNTNTNRYKKGGVGKSNKEGRHKLQRVLESGSFSNVKSELISTDHSDRDDDEILVVDDELPTPMPATNDVVAATSFEIPSLSIAEALSRLPPIVHDEVVSAHDSYACTCLLQETPLKSAFSLDEDDNEEEEGVAVGEDAHALRFIEDCNCPARTYLNNKFKISELSDSRIQHIHATYVENVNGNYATGVDKVTQIKTDIDADDINNIVPNFYELLPKKFSIDDSDDNKSGVLCETYKKYSISNGVDALSDEDQTTQPTTTANIKNEVKNEPCELEETTEFQEYHKVLDRPSYNGEILKILPYVIID